MNKIGAKNWDHQNDNNEYILEKIYKDNSDTEEESMFTNVKTIDLGLYQNHKILINRIHLLVQIDKHHYKISYFCENCMITFTTVKVSAKHKRVCQENEHFIMKLPAEKIPKNGRCFQKLSICFSFFCGNECR